MSSPDPENTPLLPSSRHSLRRQSLRHATSRVPMNEPSMLVREAAAEHIDERQSDWAYWKPVVMVDVVWNMGIVLGAFVVLGLSLDEQPGKPLRVWVGGYVVQCLVHVVCVLLKYRKRRQRRWQTPEEAVSSGNSGLSSPGGDVAKHLGSANTMFSKVWWFLGLYWVSVAARQLIGESPRLYWLCIVFLAFDVFFVVLVIAVACLIGIAVCCYLPRITAILHAVAEPARDILQNMLSLQTQASVATLKMQLQSTKKGVSSMADYVQKMCTIADNMAISLNPIQEAELVSHILFGLSGEYDPLVTSIYASGSAITLGELNPLLLNHEARVNQKLEVEMSVNVASHASNKPKFQKFHSKPKVVCQICLRPGHTAIKCYQRFNQGHVGDSSNAKSALIATPYSMQDPAWYVDSGASNHLTADLNNLSLSTPYEGSAGESASQRNG